MTFFVTWATIYLFIALSKNEKYFNKNVFISYALISCVYALASAYLAKAFVMFLYIAGISFIAYIFHKGGKK